MNAEYIQEGRITSLFGVILPPKKKQVVKRCLTIRFVLTGDIPSKKNRQRAGTNLRFLVPRALNENNVFDAVSLINNEIKVYVRTSPEYLKWKENVKDTIILQANFWKEKYKKFDLMYPLDNTIINTYHYFNNNAERDLVGKLETIQDLLTEMGIITNDSWHNAKPKSDAENYYGDISQTITTIDVTQRFC